jgi:hypothetical protein
LAIICVLDNKRSKNNKGFFIKPHLNLELVDKPRKISSAINSHTLNVIDLKSKISNNGSRSAQNARLNTKIDDITDDFEYHPWIEIGTDEDYTKPKQIQEITIMRDEHAQTHIATLIAENNEAIVKTLDKQQGYVLELNKEYRVTIKVIGNFHKVKYWFTMKPKSNGEFEYSKPDEIY